MRGTRIISFRFCLYPGITPAYAGNTKLKEDGKVKEDTNLPKAMVNYINESIQNAVEETKTAVVNTAAENIATTAINVGVAVLLFLVTRIILMVVSMLSGILTDLPIIKQFDKTGGILYGLIKALLIIFVIFSVISLISPAIEQTGIIVAINKSYIGSLLYDNNILLNAIWRH